MFGTFIPASSISRSWLSSVAVQRRPAGLGPVISLQASAPRAPPGERHQAVPDGEQKKHNRDARHNKTPPPLPCLPDGSPPPPRGAASRWRPAASPPVNSSG